VLDEIGQAPGPQRDNRLISAAGEGEADAFEQMRRGVDFGGGNRQAFGEIELVEGDAGAREDGAEIGIDLAPRFR